MSDFLQFNLLKFIRSHPPSYIHPCDRKFVHLPQILSSGVPHETFYVIKLLYFAQHKGICVPVILGMTNDIQHQAFSKTVGGVAMLSVLCISVVEVESFRTCRRVPSTQHAAHPVSLFVKPSA